LLLYPGGNSPTAAASAELSKAQREGVGLYLRKVSGSAASVKATISIPATRVSLSFEHSFDASGNWGWPGFVQQSVALVSASQNLDSLEITAHVTVRDSTLKPGRDVKAQLARSNKQLCTDLLSLFNDSSSRYACDAAAPAA
jgi:hypothetical protein